MMKQIWKMILAVALSLYMAASMAALDVNKASAAELDAIKGIGPSTSARILEARKTGEFKNWQDLMDRVKGIGHKKAQKLADNGLTVNGVGASGIPEKASKPEKKAKDSKAKTEQASAAVSDMDMSKSKEQMRDKAADQEAKKAEKEAAKAAKAEEKAKAQAEKAAAKTEVKASTGQ